MADLYMQLDSSSSQIRRLVLQPGTFDDSLHATLDIVSLDESPEYEALSYVWGCPTPSKTINLSNKIVPIGPNLDSALRHLRHASSPRTLWVDAVCINQDDLDERAAQVALMRRVYSCASTVVIWLGPAADNSDAAMQSIDRFDKAYWQTYDFQMQFMEILFRPWFTRIWTVQEFVMARHSVVDGRMKNPRFGCGYVWVDWLNFITAWAHFADDMHVVDQRYKKAYHDAVVETFRPEWMQGISARPVGTQPTSTSDIITGLRSAFGEDFLHALPYSSVQDLNEDVQDKPLLWRARSDVMRHCQYETLEAKAYWRRLELLRHVPITYHGFLMDARGTIHIRKEPLTFETILKGTMNLRSTDARDKIYGILGLLSDEARASIPIDYHKEPAWTFPPAMAYILRHEPKSLYLLGLLWRTRHFKTPLPSWVPDFTISADFHDEHSPVFLRGSCVNHAWSWPDDSRATASSDLVSLSAHSISFGRVTKIVDFVDGDREYFVSRFAEIEDLLAREAPKSESLWRTLIGIRNTNQEMIGPYPGYFETLMGRAVERDGEVQKMFQDAILPIVRHRKFFVTDWGFAGVATPMIQEGDTVAIIAGMVRAAVLRDVDPKDIGLETKVVSGRLYQRITGFAYVGCHDRHDFESLEREKIGDWKRHSCLDRRLEMCHII